MRSRYEEDEGSALVAAVGVAIIGIALCMVVVWQAIVVTQDASRDSVRTSAVHAAEAAVDSVIETLNVNNPCSPVTYSNVAQGTVAVNVEVEITYADDSGPLTTCNSGVIQGTPTRATIKATATPVNATAAIQPSRTVEASVQLKPRAGHSAAIYSASAPNIGSGFTLSPLNPDDTANVWVDDGSFTCNAALAVEGNVTVVNGTTTLENSNCHIDGSLWSKGGVTIKGTASGYRVGDGLTSQTGGLNVTNANLRLRGDVILGGSVSGYNQNTMTVTDGGIYTNQTVAPTSAIGMPVVGVVPPDWPGMTFKDQGGFKSDLLSPGVVDGGFQSWAVSNIDQCALADWMAVSKPGGKMVVRPPANVAYDLSGANWTGTTHKKCSSEKLTLGNVRFELTGDLAIFVKNVTVTNSIEVVSKDGAPHHVWFIVPNDDHPSMPASYSDSGGQLLFQTDGNNFMDPISVFMYSPGKVTYTNVTSTTGQIYGNPVEMHPVSNFYYSPVGIPGVDLSTTHAVGSEVTIEYKRETS